MGRLLSVFVSVASFASVAPKNGDRAPAKNNVNLPRCSLAYIFLSLKLKVSQIVDTRSQVSHSHIALQRRQRTFEQRAFLGVVVQRFFSRLYKGNNNQRTNEPLLTVFIAPEDQKPKIFLCDVNVSGN